MRRVKEVLRLRFELGMGQRAIARSCGMGLSTVHDYLERASKAGIGWPLAEGLGDVELEAKLFGHPLPVARTVRSRPEPSKYHGYMRGSDGSIVVFDPPGSTNTIVTAINTNDLIVGYYTDSAGGTQWTRLAESP